MKKLLCGLFGTISGLLGLLALLNLFYNLDGFNAAYGSKTEAGLAILLFASVTVGAFWLSYYLWRRAVSPLK